MMQRQPSQPFPFGSSPTVPNLTPVPGHGRAPFPNYGLPGPVGDPTIPYRPSWLYQENELVYQPAAGAVYANPALGPIAGVTRRGIWQSAPFDLAPELGNTNSVRSEGTQLSGTGHVQVQIRAVDGTFLSALSSSLEVYSIEAVAIMDARQIRFAEERINITASFFAGTESAMLEWMPPGSPIRYWRVTIVFDWVGVAGAQPRLAISAGAH